jgi:hypothetical protein
MFRNAAIRRLGLRFRPLVVWAMLPLVVLDGRTVSGCICLDGHFDLACNTDVCSGKAAANAASLPSCGCSCCFGAEEGADCCRKRPCCSTDSRETSQLPGDASWSDKSCCQPVSQTHVTPSVIVRSEVEVARPLELMTVDSAASVQSLFAEVAHHFDITRADTCTAPDLVITLRKLVI